MVQKWLTTIAQFGKIIGLAEPSLEESRYRKLIR
jgi:hypothetical protein